MGNFIKKFIIFGLLIFLCSCGGGGGTSSSSSSSGGGSAPGGGSGSSGGTVTAADNVSKVEVSNFTVEDSCNVSFKSYSYDSGGNPVKDAEMVLTVTQGSKSYTKTETTGASGLATFNVDICNDLTTSSVSTSAATDSITFAIKPKSDSATASKTLTLKADNNGKIDIADLIDELQVSIDNFTETWVKFKIEAKNGLKGKQVYFITNDVKKLLDDTTDDNGTIYYTYYIPQTTNGEVIVTAEPYFKLKSFTANNVVISVKTGKVETKKIPSTLELSTGKLSIVANDNDSTTITIYATNGFGAVDGEEFSVTSDYGKVSANNITLKNGFGEFNFQSPYYPNVKDAVITVKDKNSSLLKTIKIGLKGLTLDVSSNKEFIKADGNDSSDIYIKLTDASNNPVSNKSVTIATDNSNVTLKNNGNTVSFNNGKATLLTDNNGIIDLEISSTTAGTVKITVTADTEEKVLNFNFSGEQFAFSKIDGKDISSNLKLDVNTLHVIDFSWKDENGNGENSKLSIYTNLGILSKYDGTKCGDDNKSAIDIDITNGTGSFCYYSNIIGNTIIQAVNETDNKSTLLNAYVKSNLPPSKIFVQASDTILPISTEKIKNTSTVTALVLDENNYPLSDKEVIFSMGVNTGTGEKIYPIFAKTDSSGRAMSTFTSGSGASALNGITIVAKSKDNQSVEGNVKLTVSNQAVNISIGKGIAIENSSNVTNYKKPITVLVVDSNGSPIANQKVNLSLYVSKYRRYDSVDNKTVTEYNEDLNHNNILDPGEDLNKNGVLDPGPVATIPSEVTTNEQGFGVFYIEYPKCYAYWTDVRIIATTEVSGSEYGKGTEFTLTYSQEDKDSMPCQSPFNDITSAK